MDRDGAAMSGDALEKYQRTYADRLVRPATKERGDPVSQSALERLLAAAAKSGASTILMVPPTTAGSHFYPTEAREAELTILDFSDVRRYAALFEPGNRIDVDHLNTPGAKVFSRILALQFAEIARRRERTQ